MKPYSVDLRKRVLEAIDDVMTLDEAVEVFKVSKRTLYYWLNLQKTTGRIAPKSGYQKGHSHKIKDWDAFIVFVEANSHCTLKIMAAKWEVLNGEKISESTMLSALYKINYTSKKKLQLCRS